MKKILIVFVFCIIAVTASAEIKRFDVPIEGSPAIGPENAKVTIVEFIDYQ